MENLAVTEEPPVIPERDVLEAAVGGNLGSPGGNCQEPFETNSMEVPDDDGTPSGRHEHDGCDRTDQGVTLANTEHDYEHSDTMISPISNIISLASSTGATVGTPTGWASCTPPVSEGDDYRASRKRAPSNHYLRDSKRGHSDDAKQHSSYKTKPHLHDPRDGNAGEAIQPENRDSLKDLWSGRDSLPALTLSQTSCLDATPSCPSLPSHAGELSLPSITPIEPYLLPIQERYHIYNL